MVENGKDRTRAEIYEAITELRERVSRLEERVDLLTKEVESINKLEQRVARIDQKLDDVDNKLESFIEMYTRQLASNHRMLKFVLMLVGMILSFVAAMFGLHWKPP